MTVETFRLCVPSVVEIVFPKEKSHAQVVHDINVTNDRPIQKRTANYFRLRKVKFAYCERQRITAGFRVNSYLISKVGLPSINLAN